jgi:hypothetical protein
LRLSHRYKFIFFAAPKTGSKSIRGLLNPLNDVPDQRFSTRTLENPFYTHIRPIEVQDVFTQRGWAFNQYYRFVFVRNPWVRMMSLYQMIRHEDPAYTASFGGWLHSAKPGGEGGGGNPAEKWRHYGTYSLENFAGDESGQLLVNDVFRMEDIDSVPDKLRERGIPIPYDAPMPWYHRTDAQTAMPYYYTPELIDLVAERYAAEIEQFKYRYPG